MEATEVSPSAELAEATDSHRWRWLWLLLLCLAPVVLVALTEDSGGRAYDAAVEHIYRGVAFSDVISDGDLYPRWTSSLHWGLGSPLFTFQPPLPYYALDLLHRLGMSHAIAWRWLLAAGYALAFAGTYLLVRALGGGRWPALAAAVAYVYAPYVIRNGLERGSNEAYSMFLYPLVLWSLIALARRPAPWRFLLAVGLWAACIASHVLGPLMLAPFAGLLALFLWRHERTPAPLLALVAGGLLTAAIWAPMIPEQQWVHVERDFSQPEAVPARNPIPLSDLLAPPAVYDTAFDNNNTGDRVGLAQTALLLLGALAVPFVWPRNRGLALALAASSITGLFLFFLFTSASDPLWQAGGEIAARLLYRTRLMGAQALAAAVTGGLLLTALPAKSRRVAAAAVAALLILLALPSLYVELQHSYADFSLSPDLAGVRQMEIKHGGRALTAFGEFEPKWRAAPFDDALLNELGPDFDPQDRPLANPSDEVAVLSAEVRNQSWNLRLDAKQPVTATLHLLYYPRWQAFVDGAPAPLTAQPETGYAQAPLPAGPHRLELRYTRTTAETAGLLVSAATLLIILTSAVLVSRRRTHTPHGAAGAVRPAERGSAPPLWALAGLTLLLALKVAVIDPNTTLFRRSSACDDVAGRTTPLAVRFGENIRLCAISTVPAGIEPGERVALTLYWTIDAPVEARASSFVHLLGAQFNPATNNPLWGQQDTEVPGGLPVDDWQPGKLYRDEYEFVTAESAPPGPYQFEIGWFAPTLGARLKPVIERPAPGLSVSDLDALLVDGVSVR